MPVCNNQLDFLASVLRHLRRRRLLAHRRGLCIASLVLNHHCHTWQTADSRPLPLRLNTPSKWVEQPRPLQFNSRRRLSSRNSILTTVAARRLRKINAHGQLRPTRHQTRTRPTFVQVAERLRHRFGGVTMMARLSVMPVVSCARIVAGTSDIRSKLGRLQACNSARRPATNPRRLTNLAHEPFQAGCSLSRLRPPPRRLLLQRLLRATARHRRGQIQMDLLLPRALTHTRQPRQVPPSKLICSPRR